MRDDLFSFNTETQVQLGIITSTNDDPNSGSGLGQRRVQLQTATMSAIPNMQSLAWGKVYSHTPQTSTQGGGQIASTHSYLPGTKVLVRQPAVSGQEWEIIGSPGTIGDWASVSSGSVSISNYGWTSDPAFGTTGKKTTDATQVPTSPSYNNSQSPTPSSQYPHVRARAFAQLQNSQFAQNAQRLFQQAQNIGPAGPNLNKITQLIMQYDPKGAAEATQNLDTVQMLDQMRTQLNQVPALGSFLGMANQGLMTGLSSMIGGQGMSFFTSLISLAQQIGANMNNHNASPQTQNQPLTTIFSIVNGQLVVDGPLAPVPPSQTGTVGVPTS